MFKKTPNFFSLKLIVLIFDMFERSLKDSCKYFHKIYLFSYE